MTPNKEELQEKLAEMTREAALAEVARASVAAQLNELHLIPELRRRYEGKYFKRKSQFGIEPAVLGASMFQMQGAPAPVFRKVVAVKVGKDSKASLVCVDISHSLHPEVSISTTEEQIYGHEPDLLKLSYDECTPEEFKLAMDEALAEIETPSRLIWSKPKWERFNEITENMRQPRRVF